MDDDKICTLVQQYLHERGYTEALAALRRESGVESDDDALELGGQLCSILHEHADLKQMLDAGPGGDAEASERKAAEEEILSLETPDKSPSVLQASLATLHRGNIIACRFNCDSTLIASGSSDRSVKIVSNKDRKELRALAGHAAPILSLAWSPSEPHLLLSTAMDGTTILTDATTGASLQEFKEHTKYVHRSVWAPGGDMFATCGHDKFIVVYRRVEGGGFEVLKKKEVLTLPEAMCFMGDGLTLAVCMRDDNYMHYIDAETGTDSKVNMNPLGDDHVSFTVLDLVLSPNGKLLLASTDRSRLIMFLAGSGQQLRVYYGAVNDALCQTRACFHPSGALIYCTSQDQKVYCWSVVTQKVVCRLEGHMGVVRDIDISADGNTLISGSFDKTLKFWSLPE